MKSALLVTIVLSAISCTVYATPYVEEGKYGGWSHGGYSDEVINGNTATVKFSGNRFNSPQQANMYMLYRCAQITLQQGYDYFVVVSSSTSNTNIQLRTKTINKTIYPPPSFLNRDYSETTVESYAVTKTNVATCQSDACRSPSRSAVIKMFNGDIPPGLPRAYKAEDILAHYGYAVDEGGNEH